MRVKRIFSIAVFLTVFSFGFSQRDSTAIRYAETINVDELKQHLKILASDEYEGRETGTKGQKMAAAYISDQFKQIGIPPVNGTYYQEYPLVLTESKGIGLSINNKVYGFLNDFYYWPGYFKDQKVKSNKFVFLGFGSNESDYQKNFKNKIVLLFSDEIKNSEAQAMSLLKKVVLASRANADGLLIIDEDLDSTVAKYRHFLESPSIDIGSKESGENNFPPVMFISKKVADEIFSSEKLSYKTIKEDIGRYQGRTLKGKVLIEGRRAETNLKAENVLGYVEGTDLKQELIVVSAHYDHLGKKGDKIFNGADDDGSGTVAIIEMAEAFMKARKDGRGPRRSILFMAFSGEEKGLLGSRYYTDNPLFPLTNTVANLNIDMIGRIDDKHNPNPNYVYIIGSDKLSTELHSINEEINKRYTQLEFDYTYNDLNDKNRFYYRSDHYNFAKNNIPVIFYFNGVHEDYHKETDEVEKINFPKVEKITKLVFYAAWELANRAERIKVDVKQ